MCRSRETTTLINRGGPMSPQKDQSYIYNVFPKESHSKGEQHTLCSLKNDLRVEMRLSKIWF